MFKFLFSCFYFFLPAYFNNMIPSLTSNLGILSSFEKPVDGGRQFQGKPLLGSHKTWRFVLGGIVGFIVIFIQEWLYINYPIAKSISLVNYQELNILFFGFSLLLGASFGDMFFAFIKRRLFLKSGAKFMPWDQINYVLGSAFFLHFFYGLEIDLMVWITLIFFTFIFHSASTWIGFMLGLSRSKW